MSTYEIGNVRELGGGWELSWRPIETLDGELVGVPIIRPHGGDWIELPPAALDGLVQWSADVRHHHACRHRHHEHALPKPQQSPRSTTR